MIFDSHNVILTAFSHSPLTTLIFTTYLSRPSWLYFYIFFSFEYCDSFDHYAACWVILMIIYFTIQSYVYSGRPEGVMCLLNVLLPYFLLNKQ